MDPIRLRLGYVRPKLNNFGRNIVVKENKNLTIPLLTTEKHYCYHPSTYNNHALVIA